MGYIQAVLFLLAQHFAHVPERASHAYKRQIGNILKPGQLVKLSGDKFLNSVHLLRLHLIMQAELLGKGYSPKMQAGKIFNLALLKMHQFHRASAYIHNHARVYIHGVYNALINIYGFLFPSKQSKINARRGINFVQKAALIGGAAHRRGQHGNNIRYFVSRAKTLKHLKSFNKLLDSPGPDYIILRHI